MFPIGWKRRCSITIDHTKVSGTSHSAFPVLLTEDNLPTEMLDSNSIWKCLADGGDIRFSSDEDGTNQLPCEVVEITQSASPASTSAQIWVNIPILSGLAGTTIEIWYSKAGESQPSVDDTYGRNATWTSFSHVWHLEEEPDNTVGEIKDSTGDRNLTGIGCSGTESISAKVQQGLDFDGVGKGLDNTTARTISSTRDWEVPGGFSCTGCCYDSDAGTLWIANWDDGDLVETNLLGAQQSSISVGDAADNIQGVAFDSSDNTLWVANPNDDQVQHWQRNGTELSGDHFAFTNPNALAYEAGTDSLWIAASGSGNAIGRYNTAGALQAAVTLELSPVGGTIDHIAYDSARDWLWISFSLVGPTTPDAIWVYRPNGSFIGSITDNNTALEGVAFDGTGALWSVHDNELKNSTPNGNRAYRHNVDAIIPVFQRLDNAAIGMWLDIGVNTATDGGLEFGGVVDDSGIAIYTRDNNSVRAYINDGTTRIFADRVVGADWVHVVLTVDSDNDVARIFANGSQVGADIDISTVTGDVTSDFIYAATTRGSLWADISLDEMRAYADIPSAEWLTTEHANQNAPDTFSSAGTPLSIASGTLSHFEFTAIVANADGSTETLTVSTDKSGVTEYGSDASIVVGDASIYHFWSTLGLSTGSASLSSDVSAIAWRFQATTVNGDTISGWSEDHEDVSHYLTNQSDVTDWSFIGGDPLISDFLALFL